MRHRRGVRPAARFVALIATLMAAATCGPAPPAMQPVLAAADALGGAARIAAIDTLAYEGAGQNGAAGGSLTPDDPPNRWTVASLRRTFDLANGRARLQQVRTAQFPFALAATAEQDQRLDKDVAFNVTASAAGGAPQASRLSDRVATERRRDMLHHPVSAVRAALDPASMLSNARTEDGQPHVDVTTAAGDTFTLAIDPGSGLPSHVTSRAYDANWGDIVLETTFSNYQRTDGLQLPARLVTTQDRWMLADITVSRHEMNGQTGDLSAPEAVRAARDEPPPVNVTVEPLGRGLWWLAGGSHHSVVFEFADHLTLFEAPLNDARTLAVIAKARTLVPGKPLTHVIVSHHNLDHAGGVRAAIAEGLTIITQRGNEAFLREIATRPHSLGQDALARRPKAAVFQLVDDALTLKDDTLEVQIFKTIPNSHTALLLWAWVPRERLLVQADLYDVTWPQQPWGDNLLANVAARKVTVSRQAPIHGTLQTWPEVLKVLATAPGPARTP